MILDDAGQIAPQTGDGWEVISVTRRFRSLPEKFNALAGLARGDLLLVWEDDDIYLPWHITAHVEALATGGFSKSSRVLSLYTGGLQEEDATGRFHASVALTRSAFESVGGWPLTSRGDFDQTFLNRLQRVGVTVDPCCSHPPSYVFRWGSTGAYHGQAQMRGPQDEAWYASIAETDSVPVSARSLIPRYDTETEIVLRAVG